MLVGDQTVTFEFIQSVQSGLNAPRWRAKRCRRTREGGVVRFHFISGSERTLRCGWTYGTRRATLGVAIGSCARDSRCGRCRTDVTLGYQVSGKRSFPHVRQRVVQGGRCSCCQIRLHSDASRWSPNGYRCGVHGCRPSIDGCCSHRFMM